MKKTIILAAAAIAALSACTKEIEVAPSNETNAPVFTATLEPQTKTTLDGKKVKWENTDEVSVSGVVYTVAPGAEDATTATLTKKTSSDESPVSPFKAYYPASLYNAGTATLPASYTYTEGKFNMPMYAENSETTLAFKNICAVLAITVPSSEMSSVTSITVSSDKQMNGAFTATAEGVLTFAEKTLEAADKKVTLTFSPAKAIASSETFYIAIPANTYAYLQIDVIDGTTTKSMKTKAVIIKVERSKIYPIIFAMEPATGTTTATVNGNEVNVPWVRLWVNGPKWATFNVGATSPEGYGDYFAWGATEPWYEAGYSQENPGTHWKSGKDGGYNYANAPYQTITDASEGAQSKWTKYLGSTTSQYKDDTATDADALKLVLDPEDDAARVNWGGSWRMPTNSELNNLNTYCSWTWTTINEVNGYKIQSTQPGYTDNWIFLPAAGYRESLKMMYVGKQGFYWSSTFSLVAPYLGYLLGFGTSTHGIRNYSRFCGRSIRPVFD